MSTRTLLALLAAALLALGAAACGSDEGDGGSDGGGTAVEPLSGDDYLQRINGAQADFSARVAPLDIANPTSSRDFKLALDRFVPLVDDLVRRLRGIQPPPSVEPQHAALIAQLTEYRRALGEEKGGLVSDDPARATEARAEIGDASTAFTRDYTKAINQINRRLRE